MNDHADDHAEDHADAPEYEIYDDDDDDVYLTYDQEMEAADDFDDLTDDFE
jgi:hypothetical protein